MEPVQFGLVICVRGYPVAIRLQGTTEKLRRRSYKSDTILP